MATNRDEDGKHGEQWAAQPATTLGSELKLRKHLTHPIDDSVLCNIKDGISITQPAMIRKQSNFASQSNYKP